MTRPTAGALMFRIFIPAIVVSLVVALIVALLFFGAV
jgi:hypothetical protein